MAVEPNCVIPPLRNRQAVRDFPVAATTSGASRETCAARTAAPVIDIPIPFDIAERMKARSSAGEFRCQHFVHGQLARLAISRQWRPPMLRPGPSELLGEEKADAGANAPTVRPIFG